MEEMNATVVEVARNAGTASEVASRARSKALDGQGVVGRALEAISRWNALSRELKTGMDHLANRPSPSGRS
jgi:methyl-accepting chemotaxis protein